MVDRTERTCRPAQGHDRPRHTTACFKAMPKSGKAAPRGHVVASTRSCGRGALRPDRDRAEWKCSSSGGAATAQQGRARTTKTRARDREAAAGESKRGELFRTQRCVDHCPRRAWRAARDTVEAELGSATPARTRSRSALSRIGEATRRPLRDKPLRPWGGRGC